MYVWFKGKTPFVRVFPLNRIVFSEINLMYRHSRYFNLKTTGSVYFTFTFCPSCSPGFQSGSAETMSNAAWSSSDVTPLMTSGLDTFPVLSITNCTITRPSVCSSIAFCGYLRLPLMKVSNASVPSGNSGRLLRHRMFYQACRGLRLRPGLPFRFPMQIVPADSLCPRYWSYKLRANPLR